MVWVRLPPYKDRQPTTTVRWQHDGMFGMWLVTRQRMIGMWLINGQFMIGMWPIFRNAILGIYWCTRWQRPINRMFRVRKIAGQGVIGMWWLTSRRWCSAARSWCRPRWCRGAAEWNNHRIDDGPALSHELSFHFFRIFYFLSQKSLIR